MRRDQFAFLLNTLRLATALVSPHQWQTLNTTLGGRLIQHAPYSRSCFKLANTFGPQTFNATECASIQQTYAVSFPRIGNPGSYEGYQFEGCPATGEGCLLNFNDPTDPAAFAPPKVCSQGSIPSFFIPVKNAKDVQAAFKFASTTPGVDLVIKNSGHDGLGRSARPGSLAILTSELKDISLNRNWTPQGCSPRQNVKPRQVVIMEPAVELLTYYQFAEDHNLTLPGSNCATLPPAGGYILGAGHSALANTYGLGADRALQFTVVTPRNGGEVLIANECQNTDLYFALRGGGGGTFGVVLEVVSEAKPKVPMQSLVITNIPTDSATNRQFFSIIIDNGIRWAKAGWGGYITSGSIQYVNPTPGLTQAEVEKDFAPLIEFANNLNATVDQKQLPSFTAWFTEYLLPINPPAGPPTVSASRFLPTKNYLTTESREELLNAILTAGEAHFIFFLFSTTPFSFKPENNLTSFTPAWRDAVHFFWVTDAYNYNATFSEIKAVQDSLTASMDIVRNITKNSGTYVSESDLHEPDFETSFWGENFDRLIEIKKKYDPLHLLDCWHCIGWRGADDPRFRCYV